MLDSATQLAEKAFNANVGLMQIAKHQIQIL